MTELVSGQNHPWPETRVTVRLHGRADLSALLLGSDAKVRDEEDFVFYNAPHTTGVKWTADAQDAQTVHIETAHLPAEIQVVRLLVSVDDDQPPLADGVVQVSAHGESSEVRYEPTRLDGERCLIGLEVYRRNDAWKVRAVGQGWRDGLPAALQAHGIDVETPEAPIEAAAPPVTPPAIPLPTSTQPPAHGNPTQVFAGPDDDTVAGALRAIRSLRHDISQARRAHQTALAYAADKMLAAQENARGAVGTAGVPASVEQECAELVSRAEERYAQEAEALHSELVAEEFAMPLPLARLDSLDWETLAAGTHSPTNRAIDRNDHTASVIRLGSLYPPQGPSLNLPMPHTWAARALMWSDDPNRPPVGAEWVHGLIARMMALTPPGGFDVQLVDLDGSLSSSLGQFGPGITDDVTRHRSPAELVSFVDQLAHRVDLARMAVESRIPDALDDVRDDARHLVVLAHWPHGYDEQIQRRIAECLPWGFALDVQFVVLTQVDAAAEPPTEGSAMEEMLRSALWLQDGPEPNLLDDTGVAWCFDPEATASARSVAARITSSGQRS